MFKLPQSETKRLVALHGWFGIVLGLLLYAVIVTGTVAVFSNEINAWASGGNVTQDALSRPIGALVARLEMQVPEAYRDDLSLRASPDGNVVLFFHKDERTPTGEIKARGVQFTVAPSDDILRQTEGFADQLFTQDRASALGRFFVDLHVRLHVPRPWGLILTGILGLAMLVAAVSGLIMHRHLFADIFTVRDGRHRLVSVRDLHTVAATWTLPHAFVLAFTGAFFSFALSLGLPVLARIAFNGDQPGLIAALVGERRAPDPTPAAAADIDAVLRASRERALAPLIFASFENRGRADATILTRHAPRPGHIAFQAFIYNGATGAFMHEKPLLGTVPSFGSDLYALVRALHFGNFLGAVSKAVWFALGAASAYVTWSGLRLWLRRRDTHGWHAYARLTSLVAGGLPLAMALSAAANFAAPRSADLALWIPAGFLIGTAVAAGAAWFLPRDRIDRCLFVLAGSVLLLLPPLRIWAGGNGWSVALARGFDVVVACDAMMILAGLAALAGPLVARPGTTPKRPTAPLAEPAQ